MQPCSCCCLSLIIFAVTSGRNAFFFLHDDIDHFDTADIGNNSIVIVIHDVAWKNVFLLVFVLFAVATYSSSIVTFSCYISSTATTAAAAATVIDTIGNSH